jgi:hypothetical protein
MDKAEIRAAAIAFSSYQIINQDNKTKNPAAA